MNYFLPYQLTHKHCDDFYCCVSRATYNRIKKKLKDKHIIFSESIAYNEKILDLSDQSIYDFYFHR